MGKIVIKVLPIWEDCWIVLLYVIFTATLPVFILKKRKINIKTYFDEHRIGYTLKIILCTVAVVVCVRQKSQQIVIKSKLRSRLSKNQDVIFYNITHPNTKYYFRNRVELNKYFNCKTLLRISKNSLCSISSTHTHTVWGPFF